MFSSIRVIAAIIAVVAVVSIGGFLYMTREIAAPSAAVEDSVEQLETSDTSGGEVVFRISQDESLVEFNIYEQLNGADKTVVGTTTEIAGDILLNLDDLSQSQIGTINVNARTFATDSDRRDNAIARFILQSEVDANEFITFQAPSITGMPGSASVGDTLTLQVTGDLTVAGVTSEVMFDVTATLESADRLVGHAETVIQRSTFNLTIPSVPSVANVGEDVTLMFDFVANAVTE